jgi:hypothetical protein
MIQEMIHYLATATGTLPVVWVIGFALLGTIVTLRMKSVETPDIT